MICPYCSLYIAQGTASTCPRCGQPLAGASRNGENFGSSGNPMAEAPTMFSSGSVPSGPGAAYDAPGSNPSQPFYQGQPPAFSGNVQGMPPGLSTMPPAWGASAPLPPAMPPRKSRAGWIIGTLVVIILLLVGGLGVSLYKLQGQSGQTNKQSASSTTLPSPTAAPSETVLFNDPLTSNVNGWLNDSNCFFENSSYHVKGNYLCFAPAGNIIDANISVDVQQVAGPTTWGYGIMLRHVSNGNFYEFAVISNSEWDFSKVVNGTRTHILQFTPTTALKGGLNTVNRLLVRAQGSHFEFFINGTQVGQADDTTFSTGITGVASSGADIEVAFNNFKITALN